MNQVSRVLFGTKQAVGMGVLSLIYVRGFLPVADFVGEGSFAAPVELVKTIIPVVIGGYFLFLALFIVAGPIQRERSVQQEVRRRR